MDRGFSLRTYLWLTGSLFILFACLCFLAYQLLELPWWAMVLALGLLVGAVVEALEHALARPLERLTKVSGRTREGLPTLPPPPKGVFRAEEFQRLWKGMRLYQDHLTQARHAKQALESQVASLKAQVRMLANAGQALEPDVSIEQIAPWLLKELAGMLGVKDLYLVPLRRHCPVPVMGMQGSPEWADAVRNSGLGPWEDILAQGRPVSVCLTGLAPEWRSAWSHGAFWVVPLNYHGKAQGLLVTSAGVERTLTPDETTLVSALSQILACALHPPRWSDERVGKPVQVQRLVSASELPKVEVPAPEPVAAEPSAETNARRRRRRQKKGA